MMGYVDQFDELEQLFRPFGEEKPILEHLRDLVEPWKDESWIDNYGSLIVHRRGNGKRVMLTAQVDVQTFVLTYIHEDGSARFLMTGKGSCCIAEGDVIRFADHLIGVVEYDADCQGVFDWQHMRIRAANGRLSVGERGILTGQVSGDLSEIRCPHCGESAGCMALLRVLQEKDVGNLDLYYVFAIGSESDKVSQRGVKCAIQSIHPDVGVSIESLETKPNNLKPGYGPAILLRDEHSVLRKPMNERCRAAAAHAQLSLQYAAVAETERETALYHFHCAGAEAVSIVIPTQSQAFHSKKILIRDLEDTIALSKALLQKLG